MKKEVPSRICVVRDIAVESSKSDELSVGISDGETAHFKGADLHVAKLAWVLTGAGVEGVREKCAQHRFGFQLFEPVAASNG